MLILIYVMSLLHGESRERCVVIQFMFLGEFKSSDGHHLTLHLDASHSVGKSVEFSEVGRRSLGLFVIRVDFFVGLLHDLRDFGLDKDGLRDA